jgi:uncharacterized membrane protein YpjA
VEVLWREILNAVSEVLKKLRTALVICCNLQGRTIFYYHWYDTKIATSGPK